MIDFGWMLANTYGILVLPSLASILFLQLANALFIPSILTNPITRAVYLISAYLFIPLHELSHYLMCRIFHHKVHKVVFVQHTKKGVSGYIEHSYNPQSIYQEVGKFFIGCAPLLCVATVASCMNILRPDLLSNVMELKLNGKSATLLIILGLLSLHCTPSFSDIKHALFGATSTSIITFIFILALDVHSSPLFLISTAKLMIVFFIFGYLSLFFLFFLSKFLKFPI